MYGFFRIPTNVYEKLQTPIQLRIRNSKEHTRSVLAGYITHFDPSNCSVCQTSCKVRDVIENHYLFGSFVCVPGLWSIKQNNRFSQFAFSFTGKHLQLSFLNFAISLRFIG